LYVAQTSGGNLNAGHASDITLQSAMSIMRLDSGSVGGSSLPGYEFDHTQFTSNVNITATTEATANTVVTASAVTYDGSTPILLEFSCPNAQPDAGAIGRTLLLWLYDGSSSVGAITGLVTPAASSMLVPVQRSIRITPSAGAHTYSIRGSVNAGTGTVQAGAGGAGVYYPGYIRQTRAR